MNEKATHIDGNLSVGRRVNIGGKTTLQSHLHVKSGLRVDGWLDAANIKDTNKGLFLTEKDLNDTYPRPLNGWWAIVGKALPAPVYIAKDCRWIATGGLSGNIDIDLEPYNYLHENNALVPLFDGFINDITTVEEETCPEKDGEVKYDFQSKRFVYCAQGKYYTDWHNADKFMKDGRPLPNRLFEHRYEKKQYIFENGLLLTLTTNHEVLIPIMIGFEKEYEADISNPLFYECKTAREVSLQDITVPEDSEDIYLYLMVPYGDLDKSYALDFITSNGIVIPMIQPYSVVIDNTPYKCYVSTGIINVDKIKNVTVKLKQTLL